MAAASEEGLEIVMPDKSLKRMLVIRGWVGLSAWMDY
jgi:hypothetical protein